MMNQVHTQKSSDVCFDNMKQAVYTHAHTHIYIYIYSYLHCIVYLKCLRTILSFEEELIKTLRPSQNDLNLSHSIFRCILYPRQTHVVYGYGKKPIDFQ